MVLDTLVRAEQIGLNEESNSDDKIEFLKFVIDHDQNLVNFADTKAGIVLGVDGVMLAIILSSSLSVLLFEYPYFLIPSILLIGLSSLFGFLTIFPRRIKGTPVSIIFTHSEGALDSTRRAKYLKEVQGLTNDKILEDCGNNILTLAYIRDRKFKMFKLSLVLLLLSFIPLIIGGIAIAYK